MKKLLVALSLFATTYAVAQAPQRINYQAVARDAGGNLVTTAVGIKFEILQGSATGAAVYDETNTVIPSSVGIFTAAIGGGTPGIGSFSAINWATGPYFLRVNIDPAGGTSYSTVGTSQLLSVPYALYAATSGNASPTYTSGNGIAISSGSIINTAMNQTVNIVGSGATIVSGTYPSYTISSSTSTSAATSSLQINPPHTVTTLGPNNYSVTIQPLNLSGPNVIGSYPNYTIGIGAGPNIIGTGVTSVTQAVNNFTVNTPPVNMSYVPTTGVLTYTQASGTSTLSVLPAVTFGSSVLTIGSTPVSIPGTNIWTRPSSSVTTLTNANDNVGIGISTPNNRLHVVEAVNGIAAINAVNTYSISSGNAMGLYASSINSSSISAGVYGTHSNNGVGVSGINTSATSTTAAGVYGLVVASFSTAIGVEGYGSGLATGIKGTSAGNGISILGSKPVSATGGNAGKFEILNTGNTADALFATTNGNGAAIHASSGPTATSALALHLENGHIKSTSTAAPTQFSVTPAGGFSMPGFAPTCAGTDVKGVISFSTSVTGFSAINSFDIQYNFQKPYAVAPIVMLTPISDIKGLSFMILSSSTTNFVVRIFRPNGAGFPITFGATFFNFNYFIIE